MDMVRGGRVPKRGGRREAVKTARGGRSRVKASPAALTVLAQARVAIESVTPEIDGGRFSAKAIAGEPVIVEADIFCDGHDRIDAALLFRRADETEWREAPMALLENDRWRGMFVPEVNAPHVYTLVAWRDRFESWRDEASKKHAAGVDISVELIEGRNLVEAAIGSGRAGTAERKALKALVARVDATDDPLVRFNTLIDGAVAALMRRVGFRDGLTRYDRELRLIVDRKRAAFSGWYELMPRSMSDDTSRHGTFDDVIRKLPYVRDMGFDVLYFPPIHPIGTTARKGKNNTLTPGPNDPGSPYAIGSEDGGHDAIHPELGTFGDFARLVKAAREHGLEIALDFAIQCSPDHPWIKEHPEWFDWRPDGSIKYAENPPKKYQDIVNVDFYGKGFPSLWYALRDIVKFWADCEVRIFRVDNPHTKPFPFWEWLIAEVQAEYPDVIFLAEAFTRPKVMKRLAKLGFTQSYSYFTWRNTKWELTSYLTELTTTDARFTMRPNFFVNTPDINPYFLQTSGRPGFRTRLVLAASLGGNYGVYSGFELCEATPVPGKEEYLDSEKYEIKAWDWDRPGHIRDDIRLMNRLRNERPALQSFANVTFYNAWNDSILYYAKATPAKDDFVLFAVNLDPHNGQGADFEVPLWEFGLPDEAAIDAEDLVNGNRFTWHGKIQHIWLDPQHNPYAIFRLLPFGGNGR
ncbi:MAG TPA: alpha-1,4-glucan--maltose-1-phosphate maltosyltransferase [Bauldia sp.]|nr:alpha-1,4-glucan--maltose-1-phosphate maltosyltransferase [Bauldia sp.]